MVNLTGEVILRSFKLNSFILCCSLLSACVTVVSPVIPLAIPMRASTLPTASQFINEIKGKNEYERELLILRELRRGNLPGHLSKFVPIVSNQRLKNGKTVAVKLWVSPDYLSIGSDNDYLRVPMNPITAQRVADHFACVLPTSKIVDLIYLNAEIKLPPKPFPPGPQMVRFDQYVRHNQVLEKQLDGASPNQLIAGHKKDIVITNRLARKKKKVAIYGWHRSNGKAIQPLSTIHGNYYADYSHGVRLVAGMMEIDGQPIPVAEVLQDPLLATVISYEGSLKNTRYHTEGAWTRKRWAP